MTYFINIKFFKSMRQNLISELLMRVFAFILKNFFPVYAVEKKLVKGNENAYAFCPSLEKVWEIVERRSDAFIQARVWPAECRCLFLEKKRFALVKQISSDHELEVFLKNFGESPDLVSTALRVRVPDNARFKTLCKNLSVETLSCLATNNTQLFAKLSANDVLQCKDVEQYAPQNPRWKIAEALVKANPAKYAQMFIPLIEDFMRKGYAIEGYEQLYEKYIRISLKVNVPPCWSMFLVEEKNPTLYQEMKKKAQMSYAAEYVVRTLPNKIKNLCSANKEASEDVKFWLSLAEVHRNEPQVVQMIIWNISDIKKNLSEGEYEFFLDVAKRNLRYAHYFTIHNLLGNEDFQDCKNELYSLYMNEADAMSLKREFPFTLWPKELQAAALKKLVLKEAFDANMMAKVPAEYKDVVLQAMETVAMKATIDKHADICIGLPMSPEAELYFFAKTRGYHQSYWYERIEKVKIHSSNFHVLFEDYTALKIYAEKYGLTQDQYVQVLNSPIKDKAWYLKQYSK